MAAALEAQLAKKFASGTPLRRGQAWERERNSDMSAFSEGVYVYDLGASPGASAVGPAEPSASRVCIREAFFELGHRVWDTCIIMSRYFEAHPEAIAGKRVLEVGAGTGLLGLVVQRLGAAQTLLTEYGRCMERMAENVERNAWADAPGPVASCLLDWNDPELAPAVLALDPEVILAADITLFPTDVPMIAGLFERLLQMREGLEIYLGCQAHREATAPFLKVAREQFVVEEIPRSAWHPDYSTELHHLYIIRAKAAPA